MAVIGETSPLQPDSLQVPAAVIVAIPAQDSARKALKPAPEKMAVGQYGPCVTP